MPRKYTQEEIIQILNKYNIKLLRIPYWEFDNIENILSNNLNMENFQRLSLK